MNANDLADRLEQFYTGTHIDKAAETLRQQQAKIETLQEHNVNLVDDLFSERKEVIKLETEIEQLKALAISLSPNSNLIYTRSE